jgi:phospholipid/cholesterol/gamma-HCH transport system substrate-binding protein
MGTPFESKAENDATSGRRSLRSRLFSTRKLGVYLVALVVIAYPVAYQKQQIGTFLRPGDTITAVFAQKYKLNPYYDDVKLAGVRVGTITGEDYDPDTQTSTVSMKLFSGVLERLGTAPLAYIRPTLVLGGKYYADLVPGGSSGRFEGHQIPLERTRIPVELDRVLSALTPSAQQGIRTSIKQVDATLRADGKEALRSLVTNAPSTLGPASQVLTGVAGTEPDHDLTAVVSGFDHTAKALTATEGRMAHIVDSFKDTTASLSASSADIESTAEKAPATLRAARAGLIDLQPTLKKLTVTADSFRDSARALDPFLKKLDPVLADARPLLADLRPLLEDLRPTADDLAPTADKLTDALDNLSRRPVLDRLNGPVHDALYSPFIAKAPYATGVNGQKNLFYEEIGYLATALDSSFMYKDANGGFARLQAGSGGDSLLGATNVEPNLEKLGLQQPRGPQSPERSGIPGAGPGTAPNPLVPPRGKKGPTLPTYPGNESADKNDGLPMLGNVSGGPR